MTLLEALSSAVNAYKGALVFPDISSIVVYKETAPHYSALNRAFFAAHRDRNESAFDFLSRLVNYAKTNDYDDSAGYQGEEGNIARYKNCEISKYETHTWKKHPDYIGSASVVIDLKVEGYDFVET